MARFYQLDQLLTLLQEEAAQELRFQVGSPPVVVSGNSRRCLQGPSVNGEEIALLFRRLAGSRHMRELRDKGEVQFIYTLPNRSAFVVHAVLQAGDLSFRVA